MTTDAQKRAQKKYDDKRREEKGDEIRARQREQYQIHRERELLRKRIYREKKRSALLTTP